MEHTTEDLIFAAHVRDLASAIRAERWQVTESKGIYAEAIASLGKEPDVLSPQHRQWESQVTKLKAEAASKWFADNPLASGFIALAYERIVGCADQIADLRKAP